MKRLNIGSGGYDLPRRDAWENWDAEPTVVADRHVRVPPIPEDTETVAEIYLGHLLEHLEPIEADELLRECLRVLVPGGRLGVVVPDTRWVLEQWLGRKGTRVEVPQGVFWDLDDLDQVCAVFLFSTIQDSRHRWAYDERTLGRALARAGFEVGEPIDRWFDVRASSKNPWSVGWNAFKPGMPVDASQGGDAA